MARPSETSGLRSAAALARPGQRTERGQAQRHAARLGHVAAIVQQVAEAQVVEVELAVGAADDDREGGAGETDRRLQPVADQGRRLDTGPPPPPVPAAHRLTPPPPPPT